MNRITPELHTFKWSPKTKSKEDLELVRNLNELVKKLNLNKTQLTRLALSDFVKYYYRPDLIFERKK